MATSPNYGWAEPDNTDLVTNGALAIRTLGNAIDTTMATMTPKSIVDAKGDLIAATANDTPARLAVGTNNYFLRANSSASTGLEWAGAWTSYTPTVTPVNGSITSYTSSGDYLQIGKIVLFRATVTLTNAGTGSGSLKISVPITSVNGLAFSIYGQEISLTGKALTGSIGSNTSYDQAWIRFYDFTTCITTNNILVISGIYGAA